jgi:DNA repair protein RadC
MEVIETTVHELEIMYKPGNYKLEEEKITSSSSAVKLLMQVFNPNTIQCQEEFNVLYLDQANKVKGVYKMSRGGITSTTADTRLVLSVALKCLATGIILSHNHPSGNLLPSENDKILTRKLKAACALLDITLLDHIIVTSHGGYYSFADEGVM